MLLLLLLLGNKMEDNEARAGQQVADEELRLLEAMAAVSRNMQQVVYVLLL